MAIQFTIIGLGQIGASIGLGLATQKADVKRVGHDKDHEAARAAQKAGAVNETKFNLPASVENADIVALCLPEGQVRPTLEFILQDLKEDAVVLDVSPVKSATMEWVRDAFPPRRYYIGVTPAINSACLMETKVGLNAARADLFQGGVFFLSAPSGVPEDAIKLAADIAALLGARTLFVDQAEADSLMASMHLLPQLAAAALLGITVNQPGWREARELGGRPFAQATSALMETDGLGDAAILNKKNTLRVLDTFISKLTELRETIESGDPAALNKDLNSLYDARALWFYDRGKGEFMESAPRQNMPTLSSMMRQFIMGRRKDKNEK